MTDIKDERLSQLIAQIHDTPGPEASYNKWMLVDIVIVDGLMVGLMMLLMILRDIVIIAMLGSISVSFIAVYFYLKDAAKKRETMGRSFLDSQTILGDYEIGEQIGIDGYEYIVLPETTIEGEKISYKKIDLDDVSDSLATPFIRFGGDSALVPSVVDRLVEERLLELRDQAKEKAYKHMKKHREEEEEEEDPLLVERHGIFRRKRRRKKIRKINFLQDESERKEEEDKDKHTSLVTEEEEKENAETEKED